MGISAAVEAVAGFLADSFVADAALTGAGISAGVTALEGGDLGDIAQSALIGGVSGGYGIAGEIGSAVASGAGGTVQGIVGNSLLSGGLAAAQGGDVAKSALTGGLLSAGASLLTGGGGAGAGTEGGSGPDTTPDNIDAGGGWNPATAGDGTLITGPDTTPDNIDAGGGWNPGQPTETVEITAPRDPIPDLGEVEITDTRLDDITDTSVDTLPDVPPPDVEPPPDVNPPPNIVVPPVVVPKTQEPIAPITPLAPVGDGTQVQNLAGDPGKSGAFGGTANSIPGVADTLLTMLDTFGYGKPQLGQAGTFLG